MIGEDFYRAFFREHEIECDVEALREVAESSIRFSPHADV
jgi:hypothetical protein